MAGNRSGRPLRRPRAPDGFNPVTCAAAAGTVLAGAPVSGSAPFSARRLAPTEVAERATQARASATLSLHAMLTGAVANLDRHEVSDAGTTGRIATVAEYLTAQDTQAKTSREHWATRHAQAEAALGWAAQDELTPETLASAATVPDRLPARLDDLATEQAQLNQDERDARQEVALRRHHAREMTDWTSNGVPAQQ